MSKSWTGYLYSVGLPLRRDYLRGAGFWRNFSLAHLNISHEIQKGNVLRNILYSSRVSMVILRYLLLFSLIFFGFAALRVMLYTLVPPLVYHKDFLQEYLMAKAILNGITPYSSLPELGSRFLGDLPQFNLPHPTPHPPPIALISLPFGFFAYEQAASIWFLLEIVLVVATVFLSSKYILGKHSISLVILGSFLLISWRPLFTDICYGQLMSLILFCLVGMWISLKRGNDILAGICLGLAISFKLVGWPIALFLLIKKNWKAIGATALVILITNLVAGLLMGFDQIAYYYLEVSKIINPMYRAHEGNFSLWTIGWRLFDGTGDLQVSGTIAPPLISIPQIAPFVSILIPVVFLAIGLVISSRVKRLDTSLGLLICLSILVNPIFWVIYLVIIFIPVLMIFKQLFANGIPKLETHMMMGISIFLFFPREIIVSLLNLFALKVGTPPHNEVSFAGSLVTLLPILAIFGLMWLILRLEKRFGQQDVAKVQFVPNTINLQGIANRQ